MKKSNFGFLRFIVIFGIVGILFLILGIKEFSFNGKTPVNLYDIDLATIDKDMRVEMDLQYMWSPMYTETTESKTYGITTSTRESARGYLAFFWSENSQGISIDKFIGLKLSSKGDYTLVERMIQESDDWWDDDNSYYPYEYMKTTYHLNARLKKMTTEEYNLAKQALSVSESEAKDMIIPYMLIPVRSGNAAMFLVVGIVFVALCVLFIFLSIRENKKNKEVSAAYGAPMNNVNMYAQNGQQAYNPYAQNPVQQPEGYSPYAPGAQQTAANPYAPQGNAYAPAGQSDPMNQNTQGAIINGQSVNLNGDSQINQ